MYVRSPCVDPLTVVICLRESVVSLNQRVQGGPVLDSVEIAGVLGFAHIHGPFVATIVLENATTTKKTKLTRSLRSAGPIHDSSVSLSPSFGRLE